MASRRMVLTPAPSYPLHNRNRAYWLSRSRLLRQAVIGGRDRQWPIGIDADPAQRAPHAGGAPFLQGFPRRLVCAMQDALRRVGQGPGLAGTGFVVVDEHAFVVVHV